MRAMIRCAGALVLPFYLPFMRVGGDASAM